MKKRRRVHVDVHGTDRRKDACRILDHISIVFVDSPDAPLHLTRCIHTHLGLVWFCVVVNGVHSIVCDATKHNTIWMEKRCEQKKSWQETNP